MVQILSSKSKPRGIKMEISAQSDLLVTLLVFVLLLFAAEETTTNNHEIHL